jgi:hypothetical protein
MCGCDGFPEKVSLLALDEKCSGSGVVGMISPVPELYWRAVSARR